MSASRIVSAPEMSRTASGPRFVGVASGALRRVFALSVFMIAVSSIQGGQTVAQQESAKVPRCAGQLGSSLGCGRNLGKTDAVCQRRSLLLDERPVAQLGERLPQLGLGVHHDGAMPGNRLL